MLPVWSQIEADLTACFEQEIGVLLDSFSEKETAGKQSLQQMLSSDPGAFSRASIRALARAKGSAGSRYVLHLLRKHNLLMEALTDPRSAKSEDAVAAARMIPLGGAPIDLDLERVLSATLSQPPSADNAARLLRLLDVLEVASTQPRFSLFQTELMAYPDSGVRSRSALLLATSTKNAALVGRLLLDEDPCVQANAVEALWSFDPVEAHALLANAARSKTPRVAGNAAVGLYRIGDLSGLRLLFSMAQDQDPDRRATAAWGMGETGDTRFLPFLTAWFPRSNGTERLNILQALGRIRRREKSFLEAGTIEIRTWSAEHEGNARRLVLSLWSPTRQDLSALKSTDFILKEGEELVQDYEISGRPNSGLAISGFVLPRFSSAVDPYRVAALDGIERCLKYKRPQDLWRVDRYLNEPRVGGLTAPLEKAALPYDELLLGSFAKTQQRGFLAAPEVLRKIVESPGARERAADDAVAAFERQSDAMIKFSGKRRLFLFLPSQGAERLARHIARLTSFVANEKITLHGVAPKGADGCLEFQGLCLASEGGTFATLPPEDVPGELERIYAQSINRFEVTYRVQQGTRVADGAIQIASSSGCGQASFTLT
jgi:hypothetical protein